MEYAREHIGVAFSYNYKRAMAVSLLVFSLALAVGLTVVALLRVAIISGYMFAFAVWIALGVLTGAILVIATVNAHHKTSRLMTEKEYSVHSKHLGAWVSGLIVGLLAFAIPLEFLNTSGYTGPLYLMLTFGGVLVVLYLCMGLVFNHWFHELLFGAVLLLVIFSIALFAFDSYAVTLIAAQNYDVYWIYAYLIAVISLICVAGGTGVALSLNSSGEMRRYSQQAPKQQSTVSRPGRRKRRAP